MATGETPAELKPTTSGVSCASSERYGVFQPHHRRGQRWVPSASWLLVQTFCTPAPDTRKKTPNLGGAASSARERRTVTTSRPSSTEAATSKVQPFVSSQVTSAVPAKAVSTVLITAAFLSITSANSGAQPAASTNANTIGFFISAFPLLVFFRSLGRFNASTDEAQQAHALALTSLAPCQTPSLQDPHCTIAPAFY